jgi:hypothetical protein
MGKRGLFRKMSRWQPPKFLFGCAAVFVRQPVWISRKNDFVATKTNPPEDWHIGRHEDSRFRFQTLVRGRRRRGASAHMSNRGRYSRTTVGGLSRLLSLAMSQSLPREALSTQRGVSAPFKMRWLESSCTKCGCSSAERFWIQPVPAARLNNASCVSVIKRESDIVLPSYTLFGARFFEEKDHTRDRCFWAHCA